MLKRNGFDDELSLPHLAENIDQNINEIAFKATPTPKNDGILASFMKDYSKVLI